MKIYTASCIQHAEMWKNYRDSYPEFTFNATWLDKIVEPDLPTGLDWEANIKEIKDASALILFCKDTDTLRGAIVEAGAAIGLGKRVLIVGTNSGCNGWSQHPLVSYFSTIADALTALRLVAVAGA